MASLFLKLVVIVVVTQTLRAVAVMVGPRRSGLLLGLPVSTALVLFFLAWTHGNAFAAQAAGASLLGLLASATMALVLAACLACGWPIVFALGLGVASYLALAVALLALGPLPTAVTLAMSVLGNLLLGWFGQFIPVATNAYSPKVPSLVQTLLLRTVIPVSSLLVVLELSACLNPAWAGVLSTFPCTLLAVILLTSLEAGPAIAAQTARAFPFGNLAMVGFLAVFHSTCSTLGHSAAMAVGYAVTVLILLGIEAAQRLNTSALGTVITEQGPGGAPTPVFQK